MGSSVHDGHYTAFAIRPEGMWLMDDNRKGQWISQLSSQQLSNIYMLWAIPDTAVSPGGSGMGAASALLNATIDDFMMLDPPVRPR